ncbi:MAG: M48 family metallopeptidase, partial [bacterium]
AELNHSPRFWALVARVLPDFGERRAWLRRRGGHLTL